MSSAGDKCCEEQKKNRRKLRPMGLAWRSSHPSGEVRGTRCNTHQGELRFQERNSCCAGGAVNEGGIPLGLRRSDNNNVIRALNTCSQYMNRPWRPNTRYSDDRQQNWIRNIKLAETRSKLFPKRNDHYVTRRRCWLTLQWQSYCNIMYHIAMFIP